MRKRKKFNRNGRVAEIMRLDAHDFWGNLIDRQKAKTTEKNKGMAMIENIENRFGITPMDKETYRKIMKEKEEQDFEDMIAHAESREQGKAFFTPQKIQWTRDKDGKIVSPYSKKLKE